MAANAATPTTPTASKSNGIRRYYCDDIRYDVKCFSYITLLWIRLTLGVLPQSAQRTRRREEMNAVPVAALACSSFTSCHDSTEI